MGRARKQGGPGVPGSVCRFWDVVTSSTAAFLSAQSRYPVLFHAKFAATGTLGPSWRLSVGIRTREKLTTNFGLQLPALSSRPQRSSRLEVPVDFRLHHSHNPLRSTDGISHQPPWGKNTILAPMLPPWSLQKSLTLHSCKTTLRRSKKMCRDVSQANNRRGTVKEDHRISLAAACIATCRS